MKSRLWEITGCLTLWICFAAGCGLVAMMVRVQNSLAQDAFSESGLFTWLAVLAGCVSLVVLLSAMAVTKGCFWQKQKSAQEIV
jgi:hypothetical protein